LLTYIADIRNNLAQWVCIVFGTGAYFSDGHVARFAP